jgi:hypothetical protein
LLCLPKTQLEGLGIKPEINHLVFLRLLASAFFALLVGYGLGLRDLLNGTFPLNTIIVGAVSNGLASLIVFYFCGTGKLDNWDHFAQRAMWASAWTTGAITVSLIYCAIGVMP